MRIITVLLFSFCILTSAYAENNKVIKAAIFIEDNTSNSSKEEKAQHSNELNGYLTTFLTNAGISVLDTSDVVPNLEEGVASAISLSNDLTADYMVIAQILSISKEVKQFHGDGRLYKSSLKAIDYEMRISFKVSNIQDGGSILSDTVVVNKRTSGGDALHGLLYDAAERISKKLGESFNKLKDRAESAVKEYNVQFTSNVEGASLEIDGFLVGSLPMEYKLRQGIHSLRVAQDDYKDFEKKINISSEGQKFNIKLVYSEEGARRRYENAAMTQDIKERQLAAEILKRQSDSIADARDKIAEGEAIKRKNSFVKFDGDADSINIDSGTSLSVNN